MFLLHISGNPLSPALETLHKSKFVGVRMGLFATCLNHLLQPFKFSPAPHAPLIIISILQLFEMLSAGANAFSWHNFMRFNNASHHRCPLTQTYTCRARSGEFFVYKAYASHLRRQKIRNICLKFSQPASSSWFFTGQLTECARWTASNCASLSRQCLREGEISVVCRQFELCSFLPFNICTTLDTAGRNECSHSRLNPRIADKRGTSTN